MNNTDTSHLPKLDTTNYAPWYFALESYATSIDAINHLESDPPLPTDPTLLKPYTQKKSKILTAILGSVPSTILGLLLVPGDRPTPHKLSQDIINHINQSTKEDHKYLKTEAESIKFTGDTSIDEYIKDHVSIRQRMIAAKYPAIADEETTVDFIISGLQRNPNLTPIIGNIITSKPSTIKDFTRKYKALQNLYQPVHGSTPTPVPTITPLENYAIPQPNLNYFQYRRPYRGQFRRVHYQSRRQFLPNQRPCTFHISLGIQAQHTDAECRDPRHPKNTRVKPQAHYTKTAYAQPSMHYTEPAYPVQQNAQVNSENTSHLQSTHHHTPLENNTQGYDEQNGKYILDSGAHPTHITFPTAGMRPTTTPTLTNTATNHQSTCTHSGIIKIRTKTNEHPLSTFAVANNTIKQNLISVHDLANRYGLVAFTATKGTVYDTHSSPPKIVASAPWVKNRYEITGTTLHPHTAYGARTLSQKSLRKQQSRSLPRARIIPSQLPQISHSTKLLKPHESQPPPLTTSINSTVNTNALSRLTNPTYHSQPTDNQVQTHNWHLRLNHANIHKIAKTAKHGLIPNMPKFIATDLRITCNACSDSKQHPAPHKRTQHNYAPGSYMSSDTCGPIKPTSTHGNNHILTLICAASRYVFAHFIKDRKDIPQHIDKTLHDIKTTHHQPLQHFRTDNAKEYLSSRMKDIYKNHNVTHHLRTPHQPQENSIAERINRTIMESARALLRAAKLGDQYWEDATRDAIFKYNLLHHNSTNTSPYAMWHGRPPTMKRIFTFGQLGTIPIYSPKKKLEPRACPARYMYPTTMDHVVVLNMKTQQYQQIRALDFHPYQKEQDPTVTATIAFKAKTNYHQPPPQQIEATTKPPATLNQARKYPDANEWKEAHDAELRNIDQHQSVEWLPQTYQPPCEAIIPLMMLYRYKRAEDGTILQRKARCNIRGDLMRPGIHYNPRHITTYTADRSTQRMLIALHANNNMPMEHFDIKSAYLHEKYQHHKPVYVKQMSNFDGTYRHNSTYGRLKGNLYGSPPAAYYYNKGLKTFLATIGYQHTEHDPCLYVKHTKTGTILASTTIDDFLVIATHQQLIDELYQQLSKKYLIKRLGAPRRFLNWTIKHHKDGSVHVSQPDAIDAILKQTRMTDCNPTKTPYTSLRQLDESSSAKKLTAERATRYRKTLGEIRYITDSTRPDITYLTNRLAQNMAAPDTSHEQALKTLLRYLKGTRAYGLLYTPSKTKQDRAHPLRVYSDADFANAKDRKSVSGDVHFIGKTPVSWHSKKQNVVALSTTEAEYIAATNASRHANWIRKLLAETKTASAEPTPHFIDNRSAIIIAENKAPTKRRKYIDLRHHFLQHHIEKGHTALNRVPTENMKADILTKPLAKDRFEKLRTELQVVPPPRTCSKSEAATGDCQSAV